MSKHALYEASEAYRTVYEPLPTPCDATVYRDRAQVFLPYAEDFPKLHFHDRYEIGICEEGEGLFLSEGEFFSVSRGDAVLVPPGKRHYSRSVTEDSLCLFRFAYVLPNTINAVLASLCPDPERALERVRSAPTVLRGEEAEQIRAALSSGGEHTDSVTVLRLCALLLDLSAKKSTASDAMLPHGAGVASALAEHVALHYAKNESAEELAALFHLSESQLRRKFVAAYGLPPISYRNRLRCRIGAELLIRTDASVNAVSERLGFSTPAEFYRAFRKFFGVSPREFRKHPQPPC